MYTGSKFGWATALPFVNPSLGEPNGDKLVDSGVEAPVIEQPLEDAGLSLASPAHSGEYRLLSLIIDLC